MKQIYQKLNDMTEKMLLEELKKIEEAKDFFKEIDFLKKKQLLFFVWILYSYQKEHKEVKYLFKNSFVNLSLLYHLGLSSINPALYKLSVDFIKADSISLILDGNMSHFLKYCKDVWKITLQKIPMDEEDVELLSFLEERYVVISNDLKEQIDFRDCLIIQIKQKESILESQFEKDLKCILKPDCFEDGLKIKCMCHGTCVWKENQDRLFHQGLLQKKELIGSCEDVLEYLLSHHVPRDMALEITNFIRLGKQNKEKELWEQYKSIMDSYQISVKMISVFSKIKYLISRGTYLWEFFI